MWHAGILVFVTSWCFINALPSYEISCPFTFEPETSTAYVQELMVPVNCSWTFHAGQHQTIQLVIHATAEEGEETEENCLENFIWVTASDEAEDYDLTSPYYELICTNMTSTVQMNITGNVLHIQYQALTQVIDFSASVTIVNTAIEYKVVKERRSWREAQDYCHQDGGSLAASYPVVPNTLADIISGDDIRGKFWIGKTVSPWVLKRGCIKWNDNFTHFDNMTSKYNQLSECSQFCSGSAVFLLQNTSCYCINQSDAMETIHSVNCDTPCPGRSTEKCGGVISLSQYQHYTARVFDEEMDRHCVKSVYQRFTADVCDEQFGFTCSFLNGTDITYSNDHELLSWQQAVDFCDELLSKGLAPIPFFPSTYNGEPIWTSVIRTRDWNYPSVVRRQPTFAYMAKRDKYGLYKEVLKDATEKNAFICQYESYSLKSCSGDEMENQTVVSPGYPGQYLDGQQCEWTVNLELGMSVHIELLSLDLEPSTGCIYDFLEIDDGVSVTRLCGSQIPVPMVTSGSHVSIRFLSDETVTGSGFILSWKPVSSASVDSSHHGDEGFSGAEAAMLSVFLILLFVIVTALVTFKLCERRRRKRVQITGVSSSIDNFLYDDSTFMDTSRNPATSDINTYHNIASSVSQEHIYENSATKAEQENKQNTAVTGSLPKDNLSEEGVYETPDGQVLRASGTPDVPDTGGAVGSDMEVAADRVRCTSEWRGYKMDLRPGKMGSGLLTMEDIERMGRDAINVTAVDAVTATGGGHNADKDKTGKPREEEEDGIYEKQKEVQNPITAKETDFATGNIYEPFELSRNERVKNEQGERVENGALDIGTPSGNDAEADTGKMSTVTVNVYTDIDDEPTSAESGSGNNTYTEIDEMTKSAVGAKPSNAYTEIGEVTKPSASPKASNAYAVINDIPEDKDGYLLPHQALEEKPSFHAYADIQDVL